MITKTLRMPAARLTLAAAVLTALLTLVSIARATPPTITDTFDHGDNGWEIYEGATEYDAKHIAKGGNPGGFIRYRDADASSSSAVFADENYVSHIARYIGQGKIIFDLKTNKAAQRSPRVTITDPDEPNFPALHTTLRRAPNGSWRHYAVPVDATKARWLDRSGKRVGSKRFARILDRDPVFVVRADYSKSAGERTDFDSVGIVSELPRSLSLVFSSKRKKFSGRIKLEAGFDDVTPSCIKSYKVKLFKVVTGPKADKLIAKTKTDKTGRYALKRNSVAKGRYYAVAPLRPTQDDPFVFGCDKATSPKVKRK